MTGDKKLISIITAVSLAIIVAGYLLINKTGSTSTQVPSDAQKELIDIVSDDHIKGNKDSSVTLIEYLDFECEACGAYYPLVKQLSEEFKTEVRFVSRYFPLPGHKNGMQAALSVEAASKQGKYWEMHDVLFENQSSWGEKQFADPTIFEGYAKQIGLNLEQFKKDVSSKEVKDRVERDKASGQSLGVSGTPSFFLNGEKLQNPKTPEDFKTLIKAAILKAPKADEPKLGDKVHEHADFKVYLNGKIFDFTSDQYQDSKDPYTHVHDGNGEVTHKHRQGVTLGYFFKSIGINFDNQCFITDDGKKYCNDDKNSLKFNVNGKPNDKFGNYEISDLDKILISYGPKDEVIKSQINSISDDACLYSEKCPERGKPPTENCVGALGSDC